MQTQGRLTTPEQFGDIVMRANPDGSVLRIRDVARVELGAANMDTESRLNGNPAVSIGLYLAPGANAVQTSARVQAALDELSVRFPESLKARVFYDSSSFVSRTIAEVVKTLLIAFVLVVAVVFVFLGNVRATIIPMVAIPVSLIGTFAVLLAFGFSANTISLLAMVLGIGIVVDDAIVVVENVERVMAEEPDLSPQDATKKAMAQITGPVIAISLVLLSVFVPIAFIPGSVGHAVPPVRGDDQRGDADLGDQRADLVAGAVRVFLRHSPRPRGPMGWMLSGIDEVRDGYSGVVTRLLRVAVLSPGGHRCRGRRHLVARQGDADRIPARGRPGRLLHRSCSCPTAPRSAHPRGGAAGRGPDPADAAGRGGAVDRRVLAAGWRQSAERGVLVVAAEAVPGPRPGRQMARGR